MSQIKSLPSCKTLGMDMNDGESLNGKATVERAVCSPPPTRRFNWLESPVASPTLTTNSLLPFPTSTSPLTIRSLRATTIPAILRLFQTGYIPVPRAGSHSGPADIMALLALSNNAPFELNVSANVSWEERVEGRSRLLDLFVSSRLAGELVYGLRKH